MKRREPKQESNPKCKEKGTQTRKQENPKSEENGGTQTRKQENPKSEEREPKQESKQENQTLIKAQFAASGHSSGQV